MAFTSAMATQGLSLQAVIDQGVFDAQIEFVQEAGIPVAPIYVLNGLPDDLRYLGDGVDEALQSFFGAVDALTNEPARSALA